MMIEQKISGKTSPKNRVMLFICVFLILLCAGRASAGETDVQSMNVSGVPNRRLSVDPVGRSEGYSAVLYDNTNGLPTSEANAIAETKDGFLWIGSYSGLIRYDGNTFERIDASEGIASVERLYVDSRDRLWIGTNDSGVAVMTQGEFRKWGTADGMKAPSVRGIAEDREGVVYVASTAGIVMFDADMNPVPLEDDRIRDACINDLRPGNDGLIYGLTNFGDLFTLKDGAVQSYLDHKDSPVKGIMCILPDPENTGKLYLGTEHSDVYYGNADTGFADLQVMNIEPLVYMESLEYIDGQIWICAGNGIGVLEGTQLRTLEDIPMNNSVGQVMTDYQGNLWFTSTRQGVMKIVADQFLNIYEKNGLQEAVVNTTCMYDDKLFIGTDTGLTVLNEDGRISSIPLKNARTASGDVLEYTDLIDMLKDCRIRSIIKDSNGRLWISTWRRYGLLRFSDGELTVFNEEEGLLSDLVRAVCEREDGTVVAACTGGAVLIEGDRITKSYTEEDGIVNTETLTVAAAKNGDIILGSNGDGIYIINEDGCRKLGTEDGLSSGVVMRIKHDRNRDLFWIVTSNSIAYMTDDYRITTIHDFPYSNNFDLYENSKGDIWVLSSNGVYVTPIEELLEDVEIEPVYYGRYNGLSCITTANSYSELTENGDLYIAGTTGVVRVNIEKPFENVGDLKVAVPYLNADDIRIYPDDQGTFTIPSNVQKLTIYSYVFSYSLLDPQVEYRLEGFDRTGNTVRRSTLGPALYTNLPGGTYHFTIELKDPLGRGSKTESFTIVKEKAFYEQPWFYIITSLAALFLLSAGVSLYVRRRMSRLEKKHREEVEKERISSELQTGNRIQRSMLPGVFPAFPDRREFDIYATMEPAKEVGGDFYDFFLIDEDHLGITIADVSGKGVPAALFMMMSKIILQSNAVPGRSPSEILTRTNKAVCANNHMEMFVTVWFGILEISTGSLTMANAGHEYPAIRSGEKFELLKRKHGFVLGGMEGIRYTEYTVTLKPGDKVFLYTDGITEAVNENNEMFGTARLIEALNEAPEIQPEKIIALVRRSIDEFVGSAEQFDDLTMLCLEYKGGSEKGSTEE